MNINDTNMYIIKKDKGSNELIISYKTIYFNTYTILCMDTGCNSGNGIIFIHESFQLWESEVFGMLTKHHNIFIKINRDGICIVSLDE